jgi:D-sedoheptulose 7-phosphate isomerase
MINPKVLASVRQSVQAVEKLLLPQNLVFIEQAAMCIAECFSQGNKLILAGNGGSLCDAAHFAEELTGQFRQKRRALPAIALSDPGHLSCVANDHGFEWVFARGIEAYGKPGDLFIGLSTSGNSPNIIRAFETARQMQLKSMAFLGKNGGLLKGIADLEMIIDGFETSDRIQEAHMAAIHIIIERMEEKLFYSSKSSEENLCLKN